VGNPRQTERGKKFSAWGEEDLRTKKTKIKTWADVKQKSQLERKKDEGAQKGGGRQATFG